jgi:small-conductance mechanosensitive channel
MIFDQRFKIAFDESVSNYGENLPWILIGLAMMLGTLIVVIIIVYFGDKLIGGSLTKPWTKFQNAHKQKYQRSRRSYGRLFIILFAIIVLLVGMTAAFNIMSMNFWSIVFGYGIMSLVIAQMFAAPLQCVGGYILIAFNDKIEEEHWIEIKSQGMEGRVLSINILDVELEYIDEKCDKNSIQQFKIPTSYFINFPIARKFKREIGTSEYCTPSVSSAGLVSRSFTLH